MTIPVRPPFDPECAAVLPGLAAVLPPTVSADMIDALRAATAPLFPTAETAVGDRPVDVEDRTITAHDGTDLTVSIFRPRGVTDTLPCIYYTHGGGMFMGNRFLGGDQIASWVDELRVVAVSVEYRLAPEYPDPTPVEDCYSGLVWTHENAAELGIDRSTIIVSGESAGGGLAAGTVLLARDRGGPAVAGQMLIYPMLDDRCVTPSTEQFDGAGVWDKGSNLTGWNALLGDRRGTDNVSIYAAPARAGDLAGSPPAFIDVSSTETFRDESISYANLFWASGVQAELHVWPGGFHGFDLFAPEAAISIEARAARTNWLKRLFTQLS